MREEAWATITRMDYLQADNQMKTFAQMTGGLSFQPMFQGALPDIFSQINDSIRNQYVLTYRPTNTKNDGSYRKIKVYLVDNEGKPLKMADEKGKPLKYSSDCAGRLSSEAAGGVMARFRITSTCGPAVVRCGKRCETDQQDAADEDRAFELDGEAVQAIEVTVGRGIGWGGGYVAAEGEAVGLHAGQDGEVRVAVSEQHDEDDEDFDSAERGGCRAVWRSA